MKRFRHNILLMALMILVMSSTAWGDVAINATNFPDDVFRRQISTMCDTNQDGALSEEEIAAVTSLVITNRSISSLKGIEYLTALTFLKCDENKLTALDLRSNTALTYLDCTGNQLTTLNVSQNTALTELDCAENNLLAVDLTNNTALTTMQCDFIIESTDNTLKINMANFLKAYKNLDEGLFSVAYLCNYGTGNDVKRTGATLTGDGLSSVVSFPTTYESQTFDHIVMTFNYTNQTQAIRTIGVYSYSGEGVSSMVPVIMTAELPSTSVDVPYSYTLSALGSLPITWEVTSGTLPTGLTLDSSGTIYGTPTSCDAFNFTIQASNFSGSSSRLFNIIVPMSEIRAPKITTTALTEGYTNSPYGCKIFATGTSTGLTSLTWSADNLPKGLSLSSAGYIYGTPVSAESTKVTIWVSNDAGIDSADLTLKVSEAPSGTKPTITTTEPYGAATGEAYTCQLMATGTPPFKWTVKGKLPAGLSMSDSGLITGTPTKKGKKKITVTATNETGSDTQKITLYVYDLPSFTTQTLKNPSINKRYSQAIKIKGTKPYTWELEGTLPTGLQFNENTRKIGGTPTLNDAGMIRLTLSNPVGELSKIYINKVKAVLPVIKPNTLKKTKYGKVYTATIKTKKAAAPVTLILSGDLPKGLSFDSYTGVITGTPSEVCTNKKITVFAVNMAGIASKDYAMTIEAVAPKITTKQLPDAVKGTLYSTDIAVTGTPPITWAATGFPAGLSMDASGDIIGIPTDFGKFKIAVTATNSSKTAKKSMTLNVFAAPEIAGSGVITAGTQGKSYKYTITATGSKTIVFTVIGGALPSGITLDSKGKLSGKPMTSGEFKFTVRAANSVGTDSADFTINVAASNGTSSNKSAYAVPDSGYAAPVDEGSSEIQNYAQNHGTTLQNQDTADFAGEYADGGYVVVAELPAVSVDVSGMYDFSAELDDVADEGEKLLWLANSEEPSQDDMIAEFFDEDGHEIDAVPENRKVSVSVWLNAGNIYKPAIAVRR